MLQGALDNINLFSLITILSFFLLAPFTLAQEGFQLSHSGLAAMGVIDTNFIFKQALYAALCFHAYQQVNAQLDWIRNAAEHAPLFYQTRLNPKF